MKPELEALPDRMKDLKIDDRGFPVPWFVAWADGKPEFRAMDRQKFVLAIKEKRCWVCGNRLGIHLCFVAGPMCGINRTTSEPPAHLECGQWSARNCPFLNNPNMVRREDDEINNQSLRDLAAGFALSRNPGVTMLWITKNYEVFKDPVKGGYLITMGEPERVEWWTKGRTATREEVIESIETGYPNLRALAKLEPGGLEELEKYKKRFEKWIPEQ